MSNMVGLSCEDIYRLYDYEKLLRYYDLLYPNDTNANEMRKTMREMQARYNISISLQGNAITGFILLAFVPLMVFGAIGSALVIYVVVNRPNMRSPRNIFIVNLAISDFVLCLLTQPFNLLRFFTKNHWILGDVMCKLCSMLQGTNIFVCTISITAIALDRFQVIVHPNITSLSVKTAMGMLAAIWLISIFLSSPLLIFNKLRNSSCTEKSQHFPTILLKLIYSIFCVIIQYVVPLIIVIIVYTRICIRIRDRMNRFAPAPPTTATTTPKLLPLPNNPQTTNVELDNIPSTQQPLNNNNNNNNNNDVLLQMKRNKRVIEEKRQQRTNYLLFLVAMTFAFSWLPLVTFNLSMDIRELLFIKTYREQCDAQYKDSSNLSTFTLSVDPVKDSNISSIYPTPPIMDDTYRNPSNSSTSSYSSLAGETVHLIQAMCLLAVLGSACINPILYGWLNDNFRKEFKRIFQWKSFQSPQTQIHYTTDNHHKYNSVIVNNQDNIVKEKENRLS